MVSTTRPAERKRYLSYLGWLQEDEAGKKALAFDRISKDWAVGPDAFKKELLRAHQHLQGKRGLKEAGPRELSIQLWAERIALYLAALKKTQRDITTDAKGAPWKVAVAAAMKTATTASNPWLAQQLGMGSPFRLSRLVSACRADPGGFQPYVSEIAKSKV